MASKSKVHRNPVKQHHREQDAKDNQKFITVVFIATLVLILIMYFIFSSSN
jgi:hypothetical protein